MERSSDDEAPDAIRRVEAELGSERQQLRRLRAELDASGNVVRERVERHLEEAEMDLRDAAAQLRDLPSGGSYERRKLERTIRSIELEIAFVTAKLEAAEDEEAGEQWNALRAQRDALAAQVENLAAQVGPPGQAPGSGPEER